MVSNFQGIYVKNPFFGVCDLGHCLFLCFLSFYISYTSRKFKKMINGLFVVVMGRVGGGL